MYINQFFQAVAAITVHRHFKSQLDPVLVLLLYALPLFALVSIIIKVIARVQLDANICFIMHWLWCFSGDKCLML